jgi:CRP-like cAMP-binding protein
MATKQEVLDLLSRVELFDGLSKADLNRIHGSTKQLSFGDGEDIIRKGGHGGRLYLILDGEAEVDIEGKRNRKLRRGDYFGEMSLIDGEPRSATVTATTPVETVTLASFAFRPLISKHPSIALKMLENLSRQLRATIGNTF